MCGFGIIVPKIQMKNERIEGRIEEILLKFHEIWKAFLIEKLDSTLIKWLME